MGYAIFHDVTIAAATETIYEAITDPKHLVNWWPLKSDGEATLNGTYNFFFTPEYNWYGKVIKAEKDTAFHIKMTDSDADWNPTSFGFDLVPQANGTLLQFWHKNWPHCNAHFKRSSYCWALLLNGLKNYLEKGEVVPFGERA